MFRNALVDMAIKTVNTIAAAANSVNMVPTVFETSSSLFAPTY